MIGILSILIAILGSCFTHQSSPEKPEAPVIMIRRTGGYMGVDDQVSIFADGKVLDAKGKVRHLQPAVIEDFIRTAENMRATLPDKACVNQSLCFDCFRYTISVSRNGMVVTFGITEPISITTEEGVLDLRAFREGLNAVFSQSDSR